MIASLVKKSTAVQGPWDNVQVYTSKKYLSDFITGAPLLLLSIFT